MNRVVPLAVIALLVTIAPLASADPSHDADQLFSDGKALMDRGQYAAACGKFEASLAIQSGIGAELWLADCYENEGRTASAQREFLVAAAEAARTGDEREAVARGRAERLEPRLMRVVVVVERPSPGEAVECDGLPLDASKTGVPIPIDPGRHLIHARAPTREPWEMSFDALNPGATVTVTVPELAGARVAAPPNVVRPETVPTERGSGQRTAGLIVAGVGAMGILAGGVLGILAIVDNGNSPCGQWCTQSAHDTRERAIGEANASTVAFAIGAAALVGGGALFLLAPKPTVSVMASPTGIGMRAVF